MRMWNVDTKLMCRKHLLGEHVEMHMFVGTINEGKNIQGYLDNELIETGNIQKRHEKLVKEMKKRGYKHNSPLVFETEDSAGFVDKENNLIVLRSRCKECRRLQDGNTQS